ncbi:Nitroreductase [Mariniphaga anaerophila]|uniref:Nitroreductase n=1 Tax=Mariniphaga anaerophila TaxID=1484053 RepID=A0A1M4Y6Y1_9BACT|nr:nitroreductase family protein [Mariniphaga anaerophila]SHF01465.1 Nitroreductase [Mariniphaga anaerophila]
MKFSQLLTRRYSVRNFKSTPVDTQKLEQVLEAARMAPSAVNFQPWHFIVVQQVDNLAKLHQTYHRDWFRTAPVIIIACADHSQSWKRSIDGKDSGEIDVAIAIDHITLQAAELGLGTCWVCNFDTESCAEALKLPGCIEPIAMIPLGYPASDEIPPKKRKPLSEIVHWENY